MRLQILRQKFLQGLDQALRNKIRYKPFTTYETMVADTNKYALRMENEREETHKREFVNAVNGHSGPSEIQKLQDMIQEQQEKICALTMKKTDDSGFDLHAEVRQLSHNVARLMEQFNNRTNNSNFRTKSQEYNERPPNSLFRHRQERQSYDRPSQTYDRPRISPFSKRPSIVHFETPPTTATCHFCGIKGHLMKDCRKLQQRPAGNETPTITCQFCGNDGHNQEECRKRQRKIYEEKKPPICYTCRAIGHRSTNCPVKNQPRPNLTGQGQENA